ncbi:MAG: alpha/beta fold hydrolase [Deltaproteobacteria bacterium]|nr:alpha/beta fold hydrolase [Deltaproteobacteria bacterium]
MRGCCTLAGMDATFEEAPPLPSWLAVELPFRRRMAVIDGVRVHFVDEGNGPPVLLVHGNPTWCYLWRKVIHQVTPGVRVIAPDLVGLGLSDKPRRPAAHQLEMHLETIRALVRALDLRDLTVVGQDWGGPVAAGVGAREPDRVHGVVFANTAVLPPRRPFRTKGFHRFSQLPVVSDLVFRGLNFPLPVLDRVQGDRSSIGRAEKRAYRWPLRRIRDRAAPLGLARMVPDGEDHPSAAVLDEVGAWVEGFRGPAALVWGSRDPILGRALRRLREGIPQAQVVETQAGHFLQEEVPEELAAAILGVVENT